MQELRAVQFIHGIAEIGGAERELLSILDHLPQFGYQALVVCPERGPLAVELDRRGTRRQSVDLPPWRKLFAYHRRASAIRELRGVVMEARPSLVHVNDIWWVPQTLRGCLGLGVPVIAHVRQEIEPSKVRRYDLEKADLVLPVSRQIHQSLELGGVLPERVRTLYSGLDMARVPQSENGQRVRHLYGIPAQAPLIGTVANLFPRKGHGIMLRALPVILASAPDVHYLIVGGGNAAYEQALRRQAETLQVDGHVHFAGFQESVYPSLAALDIYVHPALMEGFGIAVLEAMAMGKPVVATKTGGVPEIVEDGETGVLVSPGDPDSLARAIVDLLRDAPGRADMGTAGRHRVESHFTATVMMRHLADAYGALLTRSPALPPVGSER